MKRDVALWEFAGYAVTALGGTLLHFLYEWTGESRWSALFSGVNESTWEHMKLLYFPWLIFAVAQYWFFKDYDNYWCVKSVGMAVGLLLIPILFYTYNGVFGKSPDWLNIGIFFVSAAVMYIVETRLLKSGFGCGARWIAIGVIAVTGVMFAAFTFAPPHIPLFLDPLTKTYGITKG